MVKKITDRAKRVKLLAMDVDGVLTGGEIVVLESGEEIKFWNSKDRLGFAVVRDANVPLSFAWITGRESNAVSLAAEDLGIQHVVQKCHDKKSALETILKAHKLKFDQVGFIGDDLIDLALLKSVGFAACPADAVADVKRNVHYVSSYRGGKGAVRDVLEVILRAQNKWESLLRSFLR
jgi:3-deoxy-D-manno-octulosonate 8-phosphate phosphatase (KDO 8-P phosphatase)